MRLELGIFKISHVTFGNKLCLEHGVLSVDPVEIEALIRTDPRVREVRLNLAEPGTRTRIIHILP